MCEEAAAGVKMNNMFSCVCVKSFCHKMEAVRVCKCVRGLVISVMVLLSDREPGCP